MSTQDRCGKNTHFERFEDPAERCGGGNCCVVGFMSRCGAGPCVIDQQGCKFFKKSSTGDRCMHYCVSLDGHCDCVDAQEEMKRRRRSKR
jgi:hypothetical protein